MVKGAPRPRETAAKPAPVAADEALVDPTAALPATLRDDERADGDDVDEDVGEDVDDAVEVTDEMSEASVDVPVESSADVTVENEPAVDDQVDDEPAPRDTNVVALFPARPAPADVPSEVEGGAEGEAEASRHAVDDIFARLRSSAGDDAAMVPDEQLVGEAITEATAAAMVGDVDDAVAPVASTAFSRRDEALVPVIVTAARKLKRVLADEQNLVLDTLRRHEPVRALDALLPAADEHVARYADAIADELAASAAAGAAELGATDTTTLRRTLAKAGALDAARSMVRTELVAPLRDRLERSVIDGGGDNDDVTRRVRSVYREWKTQHIDDQLDDVFRFAFGGGIAVTADPGTPMRWTIDPSEPACADCEDNSLAGPVAAGEAYPTGHTMAPAHPGCRCLTLPARQ
jgi:hypothetical protein